MVAAIVSMLVNVVANYLLIFGHLGFPALKLFRGLFKILDVMLDAVVNFRSFYWQRRYRPFV